MKVWEILNELTWQSESTTIRETGQLSIGAATIGDAVNYWRTRQGDEDFTWEYEVVVSKPAPPPKSGGLIVGGKPITELLNPVSDEKIAEALTLIYKAKGDYAGQETETAALAVAEFREAEQAARLTDATGGS